MRLSSLITPELVCVKKPFSGKDEIIDFLLKEIHRTHKIAISPEKVREAVFDRERLGGTVFPGGIATPHARLEGFDDLIIAVCVPEVPAAHETAGIRMLVLMLTSKTGSTLYLNTLAAFIKLSQEPELFGNLCASAAPQEFINILKDSNVEVRKELQVRSIMSQTFPVLHPENTVKEAADLFYKEKTSYLPILDTEENFVGELTVLDLFRIGMPDYAAKIGSLKFLKSFEPFDLLLRQEDVILIRDVMKKSAVQLEEDSPVVEAILKFTQTNRRHIPVVRGGRLVGLVSYMNILHKVLRA